MRFLVAPIIALPLLIAASPREVHRSARPYSSICLVCSEGCVASRHADAVTGMTLGVQITSLSDGFNVSNPLLTPTSASCVPQWDGQQQRFVCVPTDNCKFHATGIAYASMAFRDDSLPVPCGTSTPGTVVVPDHGPIQMSQLAIDITWIASCDDTITWRDRRFFKDYDDCFSGTEIGRVQFAGKCSKCPDAPH